MVHDISYSTKIQVVPPAMMFENITQVVSQQVIKLIR